MAAEILEIDKSIGISSAPLSIRIEFIEHHIQWARRLLEEGSHQPHIRLLLRQIIYYQWERPRMRNYSTDQIWSAEAKKHAGTTIKERRKNLRFDHSIPLNVIVNKLLNGINADLDDFLQHSIRGTVITLEEDLRLTRAGLQSKMPDNWNWETDSVNARYEAVGISLVTKASKSSARR